MCALPGRFDADGVVGWPWRDRRDTCFLAWRRLQKYLLNQVTKIAAVLETPETEARPPDQEGMARLHGGFRINIR